MRTNDVHPEVRRAVLEFAKWVRRNSDFPVRVPIYLSAREMLVTREKKLAPASFFAPTEKSVEPYIRIATGDFLKRRRIHGRDNALASILCSIAHELVHYNQWLNDHEFREREADKIARRMLRSYSKEVLHP